MFLKRVRVPNFRVLKDVDITFEPEFSPSIFPLGSLNGGGKSTLLQLIFILLSCSGDPEKHIYIQNLLETFKINKEKTQQVLATIYLSINNLDVELQFFCQNDKIFVDSIDTTDEDHELFDTEIKFSMLEMDQKIEQEIVELESDIDSFRKQYLKLKKIKGIENVEQRNQAIKREVSILKYGTLGYFIRKFLKISRNEQNIKIDSYELELVEQELEDRGKNKRELIEKKQEEFKKARAISNKLSSYLKHKDCKLVCNYTSFVDNEEQNVLLCNSKQLNESETSEILKQLTNKVFLTAPLTQIFLFMSKKDSQSLFKQSNNKNAYYSKLENIKKNLQNLFTYDILSVEYIVESFKKARDEDFEKARESQGEYGNAYKKLLSELNSIFGNKSVNLNSDWSGVNFTTNKNGMTQELYPEDLSHGELKRLSIYMWLRYKNIENSIVLMDEIENAFHPDWQYQIISDLAEWGATNQYILATHSYELCQALTPAHVKELEPRLLASDVDN